MGDVFGERIVSKRELSFPDSREKKERKTSRKKESEPGGTERVTVV